MDDYKYNYIFAGMAYTLLSAYLEAAVDAIIRWWNKRDGLLTVVALAEWEDMAVDDDQGRAHEHIEEDKLDEACGAYRRILTPVLVTRNLTGEIEHQMEQIKRDLASHFVEAGEFAELDYYE